MADKIAILVQLNDTEARQKIKALKDDLKQLEKGVTIKITASTVEKAQRDTTALNRNLDEVQKSRSVNVSPGTLGSVGQAATQVAQVLHELERPHQVNVTMGAIQGPVQQLGIAQQLGMPSAFEQSVRSWVQATYGINKQLPAEYYGNFYRGFTTNASGAGKDYADVTWYGKGGVQLPAVVGQFTDPFRAAYESMQGTMEQAEKEWGEWTEFMHDPAWNNIPQKYWEKHVEGAKEAKREAVSLSKVLTGIGSGFSTVGGALQGIGNLFSFDLLGTVERTLTAYGTILATQGFGKAVERYDIMSTYPKYMELMGVSAEVADASLAKINENIQGIPVGLDQAAQEIRMFTMYLEGTEDSMDAVAEKATDMAIGLEKALVAGGAAEYMQTTARYEINRLLATGSLSTSRQWQALINGLGVSSGYLRKAMGYGDLSNRDFISRLSLKDDDENKITTEEFLGGLAALADYEDLNDAIEVYKSTISAWIKNITFAMARGFENVFKAVNETLGNTLGEDEGIVGQMEHIRNAINTIFLDASDWIREHPELITGFFDRLNEVISRAKELNVGEVVLDIAEQMGKMFDVFLNVYDALPSDFWKNLFVFSTTWATPLGKVFSGIGSVFTTLGRLSGLLSKLPLIGRLFNIFSLFAPKGVTINGVGGFKALAGGIASIAAMGGIIYEYAKVFEYISNMELGPNLEKNMVLIGSTILGVSALTGGMSTVIGSLTDIQRLGLLQGEGLTLGFEGLVAVAGGIIYEFAKIGETIGSMDLGNYENNLDAIEPLIRKVVIALGLIVGGVGAGSYFTGGAVALFAAIGEAVAMGLLAEMDYASQIIVKFANVAQTISDMELVPDFDTKVTDLADGISAIYNAMPSLTDAEVTGSGNYYVFYKNMGDAFTSMGDAAVALKRAKPSFESLNRTLGEFDGIKKDVSEFAQGIGEIYAVLEANFHLGYEAKWGSNNYPTIIKNMGDAVDKMKEVADKIKSMELELKFLNLGLSGTVEETITSETNITGPTSGVKTTTYGANDRFQGLVNRLKELMTGVKDIMGVFGQDWIMSLFSEWRTSAQYKAITNIKDAIGSVSDIATNIQEAADKLEAINYRSGSAPSVLEYFKDNFAPLINGVREAIGAADTTTFESKIAEIGVMVSSVNSLLTTMGKVDISNLLTDMSSLVEVMNNDLNPAMDQLGQFTGTAKTNAMQLSHNIRGIGTDAENNAGKIGGLASQVDSLATQLGSAAINANSLRNALNNIPTNINVNTNFRQIRANPLSMWGSRFATGGPVGTDTIPAWLSEGEFVMRSKAVQTFGQQFMAQVNALNIPGALNALVRHYTLPQSAQISNISNRDNHAVVNQYISTNNPNYTYARASKYVRAL